ncbi:MAG: hypothetical protein KY476_02315 [Planctomycetes bacterium]|nr:hypothetical protein [Planctomycetota bacterium]
MVTRRTFLGTAGAGLVGGSLLQGQERGSGGRKKMAIITTVWRYLSHAQHMGDRFLVGYPMNGRWHAPELDVVSLYVDQTPQGDLSRQRADEFGFSIYPSIAEALRLGGDELAVDAVLIIGEHGEYPRNELGQRLYPRYEFYRQVARVFEEDGRSVPVFNDKHLSWTWEWAAEMVETSRRLGFPLMAGSSLPVTWRLPAIDMPFGAAAEEVMCVAYGGVDSYDFHALEVIQSMTERRRGGETGVAWVEGLRGEAVWQAMQAGAWDKGGWDPALFDACLCRSQTLAPPKRTFSHRFPTADEIPKMVPEPVVYRFQYTDGLKATMLLMNGLVQDFTFAARLIDRDEPLSTLFYLPPTPNVHYSAVLMSKVEEMFLTGHAGTPVERTLLTSGVLSAAIQSLSSGRRTETPHLSVRYAAPRESQFCTT